MGKILLVEDAIDVHAVVKNALGQSHNVTICQTLGAARESINSNMFDLILLDITLPDGDGMSYCAELKEDGKTKHIPVIFLTGSQNTEDKVRGFSLGAEDYITKPFDPQELSARVESKLKVRQLHPNGAGVVIQGDLKMDTRNHSVVISTSEEEKKVDLTPHEFQILHHLATSAEQVFSREMILKAIWGEQIHIIDRTIDTHISNLRKKLNSSAYTIRAVYGSGYCFMKRSAIRPGKKGYRQAA